MCSRPRHSLLGGREGPAQPGPGSAATAVSTIRTVAAVPGRLPGRSSGPWPCQSITSRSSSSTWPALRSVAGAPAATRRRRRTRVVRRQAGAARPATSRPPSGPTHASYAPSRPRVEGVGVVPELSRAVRARAAATPGPSAALEGRERPRLAHARPGERRVGVVRVVPRRRPASAHAARVVRAVELEQRPAKAARHAAACRPATGHRSPSRARGARSRPGRRGCGQGAPRRQPRSQRRRRVRRTAPAWPPPPAHRRPRRRPGRSRPVQPEVRERGDRSLGLGRPIRAAGRGRS